MSQDIRDTVEDLDKNITLLNEAEQIDLVDSKHLITTIFEVLKDLLQKFEPVFIEIEKIMDINKATVKGEKNKEEPENIDVKRLYL